MEDVNPEITSLDGIFLKCLEKENKTKFITTNIISGYSENLSYRGDKLIHSR